MKTAHPHSQRLLASAQAEILLEALGKGHSISWIAHGDSMLPCIPSGCIVTVSPCDPHLLKRGEVGLFVTDSDWILHRIKHHDPQRHLIYSQGDRAPHADSPWGYDQARGVLTRITINDTQLNSEPQTQQGILKESIRRLEKKSQKIYLLLHY